MVYDWLINNIDRIIQAAVAVGTLSLAYIAYLQMRENYVKAHIIELKKLLKQWLNDLPNLPDILKAAESTYFYINENELVSNIPHLFSIENTILFNDALYHLPHLEDTWNDFKNLIYTFDNNKRKLIVRIDADIKQKGFNYCDPTGVYNTRDGSSKSVYVEAVCSIRGKESGYKEIIDEIPQGVKLVRRDKNNNFPELVIAILPKTEHDKVEKIKAEHKKLIEDSKVIYINEINEIIELEGKITASNKNLRTILEKSYHRQMFDNMDCEYIPPSNWRNIVKKFIKIPLIKRNQKLKTSEQNKT